MMIINRDEKKVKLFLEMVEKEGKNLDPYTSEAIETLIPYAGLGAVAGHICLEIEVLKMMHVDYDRNKSRRPRSTNLNTVIDIKMQADKVRMLLEYTHKKFTEEYTKLVSMHKAEVIVITRGIDFFYVSYPTLSFLETTSRMDNGQVKPDLEFMALYQSIMATLFDLHEEELKLVSEESRSIYADNIAIHQLDTEMTSDKIMLNGEAIDEYAMNIIMDRTTIVDIPEVFRDSVRDKVECFEGEIKYYVDQINAGKISIDRVWSLVREAVMKKIIE